MDIFSTFSSFLVENIFFALPIALVAGFISSFSPCILSTLPLVVGYIGNSEVQDKKRGLIYSLTFALGLTITFVLMGVATAYIGQYFARYTKYIYILISLILILSGLNLLGIFTSSKETCKVEQRENNKGLLGIFLLGMFGGIVSAPCSTPVLAAILGFVATTGNIAFGIGMLIFYSIGHSIIIVLAGLSMSKVNSILQNPTNQKLSTTLRYVFGGLIIIIGLYVFSLGV